jgi:hypothetical protein
MSGEKDFSSILRGFLTHGGVVGAKERWWAGNKDFDFLTDGDEEEVCPVSCPLSTSLAQGTAAAKSIEVRVNRLVDELSIPDSYRTRPQSDSEAVQRGLNYIMHLATNEDNFKNFGSDIFQTFYDIATTSEEPLRQFALLRTEVAAQMWLKHYPTLLPSSVTENEKKKKTKSEAEDEEPSPDVILDFIMVCTPLLCLSVCVAVFS